MASLSGVKPRRSATSFPSPRHIYSSPSTFLSRSSSSSSSFSSPPAASSFRFQNDRRSPSPGPSISVQKNQDKNANAVSSNKKKVCMCSPTTHPGSFRCSLHKNSRCSVNGANGSQFQNGSFRSSGSRLNIQRSAMTNTLVRIGGVKGADLVKRALLALIRPSSHQQRRRSAFQPRPSRLSVMSRAEED